MTKKDSQLVADIIQWDVASWSVCLDFWEEHVNWDKVHLALELGCKKGGLSLWLARKGISVICTDVTNAEKSSEELHLKYSCKQKIQYENIDGTDIPFNEYFDLIIFKSIVGGVGMNNNIQAQMKLFHQIYKALKPGGMILFAENLVSTPVHQWLRKIFVLWGKGWRYVNLKEMDSFLQEFECIQMKTTGVIASMGRDETQRRILSWLDRGFLNFITPRSWKYIVYGVAQKPFS